MAIHPTALIDSTAVIDASAHIGPYAVIGPEVQIAAGVDLGPHAVVLSHTRIGKGCRIHAHAVVGDAPQDVAFSGEPSWVDIGEGVVIREGVTIHRGTKPDSATRVGDGCFLMANSHLAHNVELGRRVIVANGALLAGYVVVGDGAFISGNAAIHQFCRVGRLAMIAGSSAISRDVPPFCTTYAGAYNEVVGLNTVGLRRAGFSPEDRLHVKRAFALYYRQGLRPAEAVARIRAEWPTGPARAFADFAADSKRGLCALSRRPRAVEESD